MTAQFEVAAKTSGRVPRLAKVLEKTVAPENYG